MLGAIAGHIIGSPYEFCDYHKEFYMYIQL
ncbi:hypothetical protein BROC_00867 [Candidatus Brocadiaceae bacterium]|nr:hypothetical protein BROC_00867 [Candidatus Brocadiaceae bacterium]